MNEITIVMIDDDPVFLQGYQKVLTKEFSVFTSETVSGGLELIRKHEPDILLLDISLNKEKEGVELLPYVKEHFPYLSVIMVTNWDSYSLARESEEKGADAFFLKSGDLEELKLKIKNALSKHARDALGSFPIAESPAMKNVLREARMVARSNIPVILYGETGVGKDVVARYIHEQSPRKAGSFRAINCGAIPDMLVESELFGHERGAFTGAYQTKKGLIELASGGTLFLDEIKELTPKAQKTLLRVLDNKVVVRVGGNTSIEADIRLISASQVPLAELVEEKKFRSDLFFRLERMQITIPPLRERPQDLPPLVDYFLTEIQRKNHLKERKQLSHGAMVTLKNYHWPGNIRELYGTLEAAVLLSRGREIKASDIRLKYGAIEPGVNNYDLARRSAVETFEKEFIRNALTRNKGNISKTAREIGLSRQSLQKKIKRYGLS